MILGLSTLRQKWGGHFLLRLALTSPITPWTTPTLHRPATFGGGSAGPWTNWKTPQFLSLVGDFVGLQVSSQRFTFWEIIFFATSDYHQIFVRWLSGCQKHNKRPANCWEACQMDTRLFGQQLNGSFFSASALRRFAKKWPGSMFPLYSGYHFEGSNVETYHNMSLWLVISKMMLKDVNSSIHRMEFETYNSPCFNDLFPNDTVLTFFGLALNITTLVLHRWVLINVAMELIKPSQLWGLVWMFFGWFWTITFVCSSHVLRKKLAHFDRKTPLPSVETLWGLGDAFGHSASQRVAVVSEWKVSPTVMWVVPLVIQKCDFNRSHLSQSVLTNACSN